MEILKCQSSKETGSSKASRPLTLPASQPQSRGRQSDLSLAMKWGPGSTSQLSGLEPCGQERERVFRPVGVVAELHHTHLQAGPDGQLLGLLSGCCPTYMGPWPLPRH